MSSTFAVLTLALAGFSLAQSTPTPFTTTVSATPSTSGTADQAYITASVYSLTSLELGELASNLPPGQDLAAITGLPTVTALTGSLVSVGPSGSVISVDCPLPTEASDACSLFQEIQYTVKENTEYQHVVLQTAISGITINANADSVCSATGESDLACQATLTLSAGPINTNIPVTTTINGRGQIPLTITAGQQNAADIPAGTGPAGPTDTGAAAAFRAKEFLAAGAAGAVAVAAFAL